MTLHAFDLPADADLRTVLRAVGALGPSVTVAVGASLFDGRFGTLDRPRLLEPMPEFRNDVLKPEWCHGDLLLQVPGGTTVDLPGLRPRWRVDGFLPSGEPRNLFGFREGAGNPDHGDPALMDELVWVGSGDDEPAWCVGGTYQVVRLNRLAMPTWDRKSVTDQEQVFGRHKDSDAPLATTADGSPDHGKLPVDSHVRRAAASGARVLRRGYSYRLADDDTGQVFICYQRDVRRGFAAIQQGLAGEALEKYVMPFGGGYFFVLPGTNGTAGDFPGRTMLET
ncbi:Dyp-type peroxidase [Saccharothrix variisporea]|uniref:Dyp-type peroxidase n=1 Tax=Saccharothrix variisporea TaxID=543527 RepID=UPI0014774D8C|nr:Dyp-type peroxidase [Saccharothrix variisporea]